MLHFSICKANAEIFLIFIIVELHRSSNQEIKHGSRNQFTNFVPLLLIDGHGIFQQFGVVSLD